MKPIMMIKLCNDVLHKLENIEAQAVSLSPKQLKWLYDTMRSLNELKHIAKYETYSKCFSSSGDWGNIHGQSK